MFVEINKDLRINPTNVEYIKLNHEGRVEIGFPSGKKHVFPPRWTVQQATEILEGRRSETTPS